jgi:hypothetical protein
MHSIQHLRKKCQTFINYKNIREDFSNVFYEANNINIKFWQEYQKQENHRSTFFMNMDRISSGTVTALDLANKQT